MCPCQVCTEARDATKNAKKRVQKPKLVPAKRARKRVRGAFEGRRTSRFAGIYIYISIDHTRDGRLIYMCICIVRSLIYARYVQ